MYGHNLIVYVSIEAENQLCGPGARKKPGVARGGGWRVAGVGRVLDNRMFPGLGGAGRPTAREWESWLVSQYNNHSTPFPGVCSTAVTRITLISLSHFTTLSQD